MFFIGKNILLKLKYNSCKFFILLIFTLCPLISCKKKNLDHNRPHTINVTQKIATTCLAGTQILEDFSAKISLNIIAVPYLIDDQQYSTQVGKWPKAKRVRNLIEDLISVEPNIVIIADYQKERLKKHLLRLGIQVLTLEPSLNFKSYFDNVSKVGNFLNISTIATSIIKDFKAEMNKINDQLSKKQIQLSNNIKILPYVYGNAVGQNTSIDDIISLIKSINIASLHQIKGYKKISTETMLRWNPDIIIISCNSNCKKARKKILNNKQLSSVKAVQHNKIIVMSNALLSSTNSYMLKMAMILLNEIF